MIKKIVLIALMSMCSNSFSATEEAVVQPQKKYKLEYNSPATFLDDFLDLSKKTEEPLMYWAVQFLMLCQQKPELKEFCKELAKIVKYRNPMRIGCLVVLHRDNFGKQMEDLMYQRGLKRVYSALETRCQQCS